MFSTNLGYYAEHILPHTETRNNSTVRVKPDSKGIHLHNLSYAGPIVMGCGGKHSLKNFLHNFIFLVWFGFCLSHPWFRFIYFILFETKSQFNRFSLLSISIPNICTKNHFYWMKHNWTRYVRTHHLFSLTHHPLFLYILLFAFCTILCEWYLLRTSRYTQHRHQKWI